jgi:hypothetical protein
MVTVQSCHVREGLKVVDEFAADWAVGVGAGEFAGDLVPDEEERGDGPPVAIECTLGLGDGLV